ncbi:ABC transporter permease [Ravibacter arvi]|uniref:ABC transporter permease n=2 Tax=Ravibacter arvi TaxID=2051041 RepID=A0ABP8LST2_9BACT
MTGGILIFLFVRHHLSTDRHHSKFNRIYRIVYDQHLPDGSIEYNPEAPWPMASALRSELPGEEQAAFLSMNQELTLSIDLPGQGVKRFLMHSGSAFAEPEWFGVFDFQWLAGNPETALSEPNTVVLTESSARRYFGALDPIGRRIRLNDTVDATVTGVLAEPVGATDLDLDVYISVATLPSLKPGYAAGDWSVLNSTDRVFVVLKDIRSFSNLETTLAGIAARSYGSDAGLSFHAQPLADVHFDVKRRGGVIRASMLWSLAALGVLLVLTACINFVNMATAQALRRGKEVGVRKILGSSRGQLTAQFLVETSLVAVSSLLAALLLTALLLPVFSSWAKTPLQFYFDTPTVLFLVLLIVIVIFLAGGYPSITLSGLLPVTALRGKLIGHTVGGLQLRQLLVGAQFVIGQVLMIGAIVVAAQMRYIQHADIGFQKENIVLVNLPPGRPALQQAFKNELRNYPSVKDVSISFLPLSTPGMYGGTFKFGNRDQDEKFVIRERFADADYLDTYGLKLIAGRNITPSDTIKEYVVNEALLRKLNIQDPQQIIGQSLQYYRSAIPLPIVGVVRDFHLQSVHEAVQPCFIASSADLYRQASIRLSGQRIQQSLRQIEGVWQKFYPTQVFEATFLDENLARYYETEILISRLVDTATLVAILIGCLGLYGLMTFVVIQRTKEIGIRRVLGASAVSVVKLLADDFLRLVLMAFLVAAPIGWYLMNRWLEDFAYRIELEWWCFGAAGLSMTGVALVTVVSHSLKAALANPVKSLRSE